ncbi:KIF-1 binding protein like protein [Aduncisulcus paluster]|uniref:KIF-binding protein n=1 Tax=Aduncisulcus paluster TaxID=2918883 RepID=A0ABQ5KDT0_9EUKA|nr:KIF-1 binding protein like protein [Aduncisulcus paluster]
MDLIRVIENLKDYRYVDKIREANLLASVEDDPREPYKSKYKAKKIFIEIMAFIDKLLSEVDETDIHAIVSLKDLRSYCQVFIGFLLYQTDEITPSLIQLGQAFKHLMNRMGMSLKHDEMWFHTLGENFIMENTKEIPIAKPQVRARLAPSAVQCANLLGMAWGNLSERKLSRTFLRAAEKTYRRYKADLTTHGAGLESISIRNTERERGGGPSSSPVTGCGDEHDSTQPLSLLPPLSLSDIEETYTLTLYYLGQALVASGSMEEGSQYISRTLSRQRTSSTFDPVEWCRNAVKLCEFHNEHQDYTNTMRMIKSVEKIMDEHPDVFGSKSQRNSTEEISKVMAKRKEEAKKREKARKQREKEGEKEGTETDTEEDRTAELEEEPEPFPDDDILRLIADFFLVQAYMRLDIINGSSETMRIHEQRLAESKEEGHMPPAAPGMFLDKDDIVLSLCGNIEDGWEVEEERRAEIALLQKEEKEKKEEKKRKREERLKRREERKKRREEREKRKEREEQLKKQGEEEKGEEEKGEEEVAVLDEESEEEKTEEESEESESEDDSDIPNADKIENIFVKPIQTGDDGDLDGEIEGLPLDECAISSSSSAEKTPSVSESSTVHISEKTTIPDEIPVMSRKKAYSEFMTTFRLFKKALKYYELEGFVTTHVEILRHISMLYRILTYFESDSTTKAKLHRRRVTLLNPLPGLLSPSHYLPQIRMVANELYLAQDSIFDIKIDDLQKIKDQIEVAKSTGMFRSIESSARELGRMTLQAKHDDLLTKAKNAGLLSLKYMEIYVATFDRQAALELARELPRQTPAMPGSIADTGNVLKGLRECVFYGISSMEKKFVRADGTLLLPPGRTIADILYDEKEPLDIEMYLQGIFAISRCHLKMPYAGTEQQIKSIELALSYLIILDKFRKKHPNTPVFGEQLDLVQQMVMLLPTKIMMLNQALQKEKELEGLGKF